MSFSNYYSAYWLRPVRALGLILLIIIGLATLAFVFPWLNQKRRGLISQYWSRRLLRLMGIRLHITGTRPASAAVLVANHVSWADPFLLVACYPVQFVAKAEIRSWPIFGWIAAQGGTIFIQRERQRDLATVAQAFVAYLKHGTAVGMFPESTTSDGTQLLPFKPALFQVAVNTAADCYPVAIHYDNCAAIWTGDMGFVSSIWRIMAQPRINASVNFCSPIHYQGQHRRELAAASASAISAALSLPDPHSSPEIPADLPAAAR